MLKTHIHGYTTRQRYITSFVQQRLTGNICSEDKAYDFINAWLDQGSAKGLLDNFGYAATNDAGMAEISAEELVAADVSPVDGTLLAQTPIDHAVRAKMLEEFELIKSGF